MPVKLEQLRLDTLAVHDPRFEALFQKLIRDVVRDCEDRPNLPDKRKIKLEFELVPVFNSESRECDEVILSLGGNTALPKYKSDESRMRTAEGKLEFNPGIPDSIDQHPLPFEPKS